MKRVVIGSILLLVGIYLRIQIHISVLDEFQSIQSYAIKYGKYKQSLLNTASYNIYIFSIVLIILGLIILISEYVVSLLKDYKKN